MIMSIPPEPFGMRGGPSNRRAVLLPNDGFDGEMEKGRRRIRKPRRRRKAMDPEELAGAYVRQADTHAREREYDEALRLYDRAIEVDTEFLDAWTGKAGVLRILGRLREALECVNEALAIGPSPVAEILRERVVEDLKRQGRL
jgi:tetratricopeptide (TPR) repeat protein